MDSFKKRLARDLIRRLGRNDPHSEQKRPVPHPPRERVVYVNSAIFEGVLVPGLIQVSEVPMSYCDVRVRIVEVKP